MFNKSDLTDRKSNLSDAKRALLEKRIKGQLKGEPISKGIPRRSQQTNVPLSYAQQRLWLVDGRPGAGTGGAVRCVCQWATVTR